MSRYTSPAPYANTRTWNVLCGTEIVGTTGSEHTARAMAAALMSVDPANVYYVR